MRRAPSARLMRWTFRLQRSWTHWLLQRTTKALAKAQRQLELLLVLVDSQLLRLKELEQKGFSLEHRLAEMEESHRYRVRGVLANPTAALEETPDLDRLLGL